MKILHTSDWHLGHVLYGYDRREEQQAMLCQMADIVSSEQPDLFILAGDVYDNTQPSAAVQTMFADAMVAIHNACPSTQIVCISGNHDSSSKHMIFSSPWRTLNVTMVGSVARRPDQVPGHVYKFDGKCFVVAVPYAAERLMLDGLYQQLDDFVSRHNTEELPVVLVAHVAVRGADFNGHDHATMDVVGGLDCIDFAMLGSCYDYVALGHIHRPQFIHGTAHRFRYCGTPVPVSFDEVDRGSHHSVSIVEIAKHGDVPQVRTIDIDNPRPLVNLPVCGFASWDEVERLFDEFPSDIPAYIRLNVSVEDTLPVTANDSAARIAEAKMCRLCLINSKRVAPASHGNGGRTNYSVAEFATLTKMQVAQKYFESIDVDFDEDMRELFEQAECFARESDNDDE